MVLWLIVWLPRLLKAFLPILYVLPVSHPLSKLAVIITAYPKQKELLSPPKAIQNTEELLLLIKILESQERYLEVVKLLDSENLGISSRIVQNDLSFIGAKLNSLHKAGMWTEGLAYVKSLLAIPKNEDERKALQEVDDWIVWGLLVASVQNINTPE